MVVVLVLLTLTLSCNQPGTLGQGPGDLFTKDGVLVQQKGGVRNIEAFWTVMVRIRPPVQPDIKPWLDKLKTIVTDQRTSIIPLKDRQLWLSQLYRISLACYGRGFGFLGLITRLPAYQQTSQNHSYPILSRNPTSAPITDATTTPFTTPLRAPGDTPISRVSNPLSLLVANDTTQGGVDRSRAFTEPDERLIPIDQSGSSVNLTRSRPSRGKRALFGIFGKISKSLFGTATEEDMGVLKENLIQARADSRVLFSNQQKLVSVFDQTKHFLAENRFGIKELQSNMAKIYKIGIRNAQTVSALTTRIDALTLAREIDVNINHLFELVDIFQTQKQIFQTQKNHLQRGWLSEEILPPDQLVSILRAIQDSHFGVLSNIWYYEYLPVTPLWELPQDLVYKILVPGLSAVDYLHYAIHYFYIPLGEEHLRQVEGQSEVVVSTASDRSFIPEEDYCLGFDPRVCQPRKIDLIPTCETSLVTGLEGHELCKITIIPRNNQTVAIYKQSLGTNDVVIVAYTKIQATMRCVGQRPASLEIFGPTRLSILQNCSLETEDWRIPSIRQVLTNIHISFKGYVMLPPLNVSWPVQLKQTFADMIKMTKVQTIAIGQVIDLEQPEFKEFIETAWSDYQWYIIGGLAMLIGIIVLGTGGVMVCKVYCRALTGPRGAYQGNRASDMGGMAAPGVPSAPPEAIPMLPLKSNTRSMNEFLHSPEGIHPTMVPFQGPQDLGDLDNRPYHAAHKMLLAN